MDLGQYSYKAVVTRVIDGDTLDLKVDLGFKLSYTIRIRVLGIDTPETYGKNASEEGKVVKAYVKELLTGEEVIVETYKYKKGKYGRYLGNVYFGCKINLSEHLLEKGMAKVYGK